MSDIHITLDLWTAPNHLPVFAINAHLTTDQLERHDILLGLRELHGKHSGENIAKLVLEVLEDFQILGKLGYFVMDNATVNDTMMGFIADRLREEGIQYNPDHRRLRCLGHVINLAV